MRYRTPSNVHIDFSGEIGVERTHPMESSPRDLARRSRLAFIFVQFFFLWEATLYSPYAVCQGR